MINIGSGGPRSIARRIGCPLGSAGCVSTLVITILVIGLAGGIFFFIMNAFKSSPVYTEAMEAARSNPAATGALGTPIESGWWMAGSLSEQGLSGDASFVIPISGPKRGGTLYAAARKGNGIWQFYTLAVQVDGDNEIIQLQR